MGSHTAPGAHEAIEAITDDFVEAFDAMLRLRPTPDAFDRFGRASMAGQVRAFVAAGDPIPLLLPGFAHKNHNRAKVLGPLPDLAEHAALAHLDAFCARIAHHYAPGCRLTLVADGRVWQDRVQVRAADAEAYNAELRRMVEPLRWLDVVGLGDLWPDAEPSGAALEDALLGPRDHTFVGQLLELADVAPESPAGQSIARVRRLIAEDGLDATPVQMLTRHRAFGALLERCFPRHLRLSVHVQADHGPRFGCRFGPTVPARGHTPILPYHGVAVVGPDDTIDVMHLADAWALPGGVTLETRHGRPWCVRRHRS